MFECCVVTKVKIDFEGHETNCQTFQSKTIFFYAKQEKWKRTKNKKRVSQKVALI